MNQSWNADQYINHASFVAEHGLPVLKLLSPQKGEKILDLGCGDGALTKEIINFGAHVHGIDSSSSMVESAQKRGISAEMMSGDNLPFKNEFDAVFSNAALHWMTNSEAVIQSIHNALKARGRFVGEFGGQGNINSLVNAMKKIFDEHPEFGEFINPWYFPSTEEYKTKLQNHGFRVDAMELIQRPTLLESGIKEWLKTFSSGIINNFNEEQTSYFLNKMENVVRPDLYRNNQWVADYVRLRFSAQKI